MTGDYRGIRAGNSAKACTKAWRMSDPWSATVSHVGRKRLPHDFASITTRIRASQDDQYTVCANEEDDGVHASRQCPS